MRFSFLFFSFIIFLSCNAQNESPELIESIEFDLIDDVILIKLEVNGIENQTFIFDTGAGSTLIGKSLGDKLGLVNGNVFNNSGAAGISQIESYRGNSLRIGKIMMDNISFMKGKTDLSKTSILGVDVDGIIGYDILSKYVLKINYSNNQIEFYSNGDFDEINFGKKYKFSLMHNVPFISLNNFKIGGERFRGKFLLDTGAQPNLVFTSHFVRHNNLEKKITKSYSFISDIGTSNVKTKNIICRTSEISLFNKTFSEIPTVLSTAKAGALSLNSFQGVLGNSILKKFNITYNYLKDEIYVSPNIHAKEVFRTNCFGALYNKNLNERKLLIRGFIKNSAAESSNLKKGDEIIEVNGISVSKKSKVRLKELFSIDSKKIEIKYIRDDKVYSTNVLTKELI